MATLGDVSDFRDKTERVSSIDATGESFDQFRDNLRARLGEVAEAIIKGLDISPEEAKKLPEATPLPPEAEQKFSELQLWYQRETHPPFESREGGV